MKIAEVISFLETIAPPAYQEGYDNSGLLVGDRHADIKGVLICLDSTEAVIEEAIALGCNLVVAHHPIIFGGLKRLSGNSYVERAIIKAIKNDVAIYAAHTNLDNVFSNGVNAKIAQKLGLENTRILSPKKGLLKKLYTFAPQDAAEKIKNALFTAGAGHIGNYSECSYTVQGTGTFKGSEHTNPAVGEKGIRHHESEQKVEVIFPAYREKAIVKALLAAHPYEEVAYDVIALDNTHPYVGAGIIGNLPQEMETLVFLEFLKQTMQTGAVRYTNIHQKTVKKVAVCGGAGSFLLKDAIAAGADVFVSGDFKYHEFFDADNRILIADIGHFESEQFTIELFFELILQNFTTFAIHQTSVKTNPVNYL